jgi:glycosyl transferase family 2
VTRSFRTIALLAAYNEADVISSVIGHLVENGVDVYLIDNRSTDDTTTQARPWLGRGLLEIEEFPGTAAEGGEHPFDWTAILRRKEELAATLDADWFLHHDADEFRETPWPGIRLGDGIRWVDRLGYNCIDFRVFNFPPVDDTFAGGDPRAHFRYWSEAPEFDRSQLKCWKNDGGPVSLMPSGGHEVGIPNRRVFPIPFLLRHYPIRGQAHGRRKVFSDRRGRFVDRERARQWHIQYDGIDESHDFLADPATLRPFDEDQVRLELMLDNAVTRHEKWLADRARDEAEVARLRAVESADSAANFEQRARDREVLADERGRLLAEREKTIEASQARIAELERALGREEGRRQELERPVNEREGSREG